MAGLTDAFNFIIFGGTPSEFDTGVELERQPVSGFVPGSDPLLASLQRDQLLQLGQDPSQLAGQGSPVMQFLQAPLSGAIGPFTGDFHAGVFTESGRTISREVARGVAEGRSEQEIVNNVISQLEGSFAGTGFPERAAVAAGFSDLGDLIRSQVQFEQQKPEEAERARGLLEATRAGREASIRGISEILQDFPLPTQAAIDELSGTFADDLRRDRLQRANVGGFPADLRNIDREGLLQAIGVFGGQQQLAGGALSALQGAETQRLVNALSTQQQGQAAQLGAAQLAGAQSQAFANLGTQANIADAQLQQERDMAIFEFISSVGGSALGGSMGGGAPAGG
jgi:hypothetical protein